MEAYLLSTVNPLIMLNSQNAQLKLQQLSYNVVLLQCGFCSFYKHYTALHRFCANKISSRCIRWHFACWTHESKTFHHVRYSWKIEFLAIFEKLLGSTLTCWNRCYYQIFDFCSLKWGQSQIDCMRTIKVGVCLREGVRFTWKLLLSGL